MAQKCLCRREKLPHSGYYSQLLSPLWGQNHDIRTIALNIRKKLSGQDGEELILLLLFAVL